MTTAEDFSDAADHLAAVEDSLLFVADNLGNVGSDLRTAGERLSPKLKRTADRLTAIEEALPPLSGHLVQLDGDVRVLTNRVAALEQGGPSVPPPAPDPTPPVEDPVTPPPDIEPDPDPTPTPHGGATLAPPPLVWRARPPLSKAKAGPGAPPRGFVFNDDRPYPNGDEILGPNVSRPIYSAGILSAKRARTIADRSLARTVTVAEIVEVGEIVDGWIGANANLCLPVGNITATSGQISTTTNVLSGVLFAAADVGYEPSRMADLDQWIVVPAARLADRNWRANHNYRTWTLVTYAAALSARYGTGVPTSEVLNVKAILDDHVGRSFYGGDRNREEEGRERGIAHYPLIECHSIAVATVWLLRHGQDLSDASRSTLRRYLFSWWPRILRVVEENPIPNVTPPSTAKTDDGKFTARDIGPVDLNHVGPSLEWLIAADLAPTGATVPSNLRGRSSSYVTYSPAPLR